METEQHQLVHKYSQSISASFAYLKDADVYVMKISLECTLKWWQRNAWQDTEIPACRSGCLSSWCLLPSHDESFHRGKLYNYVLS